MPVQKEKIHLQPGVKLIIKSKGPKSGPKSGPKFVISVKKKRPYPVRLAKSVGIGAVGGAMINAATAAALKKLTGKSWISPKDAAAFGAIAGGLQGILKTARPIKQVNTAWDDFVNSGAFGNLKKMASIGSFWEELAFINGVIK